MTSKQTDLCFLSIEESSRLIHSGQLSPVELTQAYLDRIEAVDEKVGGYITVLAEAALAEAREAEKAITGGQSKGPLHGIPMAHKDLYDTAGVRTTGGSKVMEHRVPTEDATVIARLNDAGSVLLGKAAMFEFAMGGPKTSLFETVLHPWNREYATGGSSSGSAAAVAAALCMGSLGSDTGGSIRGPASSCGIVGHKPTYGLVSRYGVLALSYSLDHCGPMTWTVEDSALMLQAIAGHDPKDPASVNVPVPDYSAALREDVRGLVLGVPEEFCFGADSEVDPEVQALVKKALSDLEGLGARVEPIEMPCLEYAQVVNNVIFFGEAFNLHLPNLKAQPQNYGQAFIEKIQLGAMVSSSDYAQAMRVRSGMRRQMHELMERVDLIVTPTGHKPPGKLKDFSAGKDFLYGHSFMAPFNETGQPSISVPCGLSAEGLPVGLQISGRPFDDATVLRAAYTYQQHAGWHKRRPVD